MGKKYIIELEEMIVSTADGQMPLYKIKGLNTPTFDSVSINKLTPYSEPDLSVVRNEAYKESYDKGYQDAVMKIGSNEHAIAEKAYQGGRIDAWDVARKIACDRAHGGFRIDTKRHIFGAADCAYILANYTAFEAVEKIRQYEQEQEEIKIGNEIENDDERYIVLQKYLNNIDEPMAVLFNKNNGHIGIWHLYNANGAIFKKTGRHFPEIAEVFKKIQEEKE